MLASKKISNKFQLWNTKWKAPYGRTFIQKLLPKCYQENNFWGRYDGMFSYQPNNDTRIFEYPWAYYSGNLQRGISVVEIGGGFSGFSFALGKEGHQVINIDPFLDYGPHKHYDSSPDETIRRINRTFHTNVQFKRCTIDQAGLEERSVDRVFCISVIEHLSEMNAQTIFNEVRRILKPKGLFILTVDLFLNLTPFTKRQKNVYGKNVNIKSIIEKSGMVLIQGKKEELYGFKEFDADKILSSLEQYYVGNNYPSLIQTFVLQKA